MDILATTYSAAQVTRVAGISPATLQNWANRKLIVGHKGGGGKGVRRTFTWHNLMEVTTAAALINMGCKPADAFEAAGHFSHSGLQSFEGPDGRVIGRIAGLPWHVRDGGTFLFVAGDLSYEALVDENDWLNIRRVQMQLLEAPAFLAIDMLSLFSRVGEALGLDWKEVLDVAYASEEEAD